MASFDSPPPPRVVNDRAADRKKTLLGGKVVFGEAHTVRDCTIRNLSETGAKITLAKGDVVPTRVYLIDPRTALAYEAMVTWIKPPNFGLRFLQVHDLKLEIPGRLQFLKRVSGQVGSPRGS